MKKHVVVQSYDKTWANDFVAIRDELNTVLKDLVLRIEHVGSTSVEGLSAKPMAYVDWVYVLPEYRHKGIAQSLFKALENDCIDNEINQYYLIRSINTEADRFYHSFEAASLSEAPILRKEL